MTPFRTQEWLEDDSLSHGFFSKIGGVSTGTYVSLNAGYCDGDDDTKVRQNRARIAIALGAKPPKLLTCEQVHSTKVIVADASWSLLWPKSTNGRPQADAIVTQTPGLAIGALTADCAPVLFADLTHKVIGVAHAGWRGALAGVTDTTIMAMESLGARRNQIVAVIGPCICQDNYEVGPEFREQFSDSDAQFFKPNSTGKASVSEKLNFDLKAYVTDRLNTAGVKSVYALPDCTYGAPDRYFSYRYNTHQNESGYGRNISAIMLR